MRSTISNSSLIGDAVIDPVLVGLEVLGVDDQRVLLPVPDRFAVVGGGRRYRDRCAGARRDR